MRLINAKTYELREFFDHDIPLYAILSHTWGPDEVSLYDMQNLESARRRQGFEKIQYTCQQAIRDGWDWAWVDTCCIDKTSSAELSEAINSMHRWYSNSAVCYAYLSDVTSNSSSTFDIYDARWFGRGWTLQELVAPRQVIFFDEKWTYLKSKLGSKHEFSLRLGIPSTILDHTWSLHDIPVAVRMSWAANRETTRLEDRAYSLLGIFDIHMPCKHL